MPYKPVEPDRRWLLGPRFWTLVGFVSLIVFVGVVVRDLGFRRSIAAQAMQMHIYGQGTLVAGSRAWFRIGVRDEVKQTPIEGVGVYGVLNRLGATQGEFAFPRATTNEEGVAVLSAKLPRSLVTGHHTLLARAVRGPDRAELGSIVKILAHEDSRRAVVVTDKPRYQPGQVIHMRSLVLGVDRRPEASAQVAFEVRDSRGNTVFRESKPTSAFGIATTDLELADKVNLGEYTIALSAGAVRAERKVKVATYTLPRFKVAVEADRAAYRAGETITGQVEARYTFGEPVRGADVMVTASDPGPGPGDIAITTKGRTDNAGRFRFKLEGRPGTWVPW